MGIFYFILVFIGLYVTGYSFFETNIHSYLYSCRDFICIEEYKKKEKVTDIVSIVHNICMFLFGITIFLFGLSNLVILTDIPIKLLLGISTLLVVFDTSIICIIIKAYDLYKTRDTIIKKWEKEKVFKEEHNHEVNMVRAVDRTDKYRMQCIFSLVLILIILILV